MNKRLIKTVMCGLACLGLMAGLSVSGASYFAVTGTTFSTNSGYAVIPGGPGTPVINALSYIVATNNGPTLDFYAPSPTNGPAVITGTSFNVTNLTVRSRNTNFTGTAIGLIQHTNGTWQRVTFWSTPAPLATNVTILETPSPTLSAGAVLYQMQLVGQIPACFDGGGVDGRTNYLTAVSGICAGKPNQPMMVIAGHSGNPSVASLNTNRVVYVSGQYAP